MTRDHVGASGGDTGYCALCVWLHGLISYLLSRKGVYKGLISAFLAFNILRFVFRIKLIPRESENHIGDEQQLTNRLFHLTLILPRRQ